MSLISCRECGQKVSDTAVSCPNCGAPNHAMTGLGRSPIEGTKQGVVIEKTSKAHKKWYLLGQLAVVICVIGLLASGCSTGWIIATCLAFFIYAIIKFAMWWDHG